MKTIIIKLLRIMYIFLFAIKLQIDKFLTTYTKEIFLSMMLIMFLSWIGINTSLLGQWIGYIITSLCGICVLVYTASFIKIVNNYIPKKITHIEIPLLTLLGIFLLFFSYYLAINNYTVYSILALGITVKLFLWSPKQYRKNIEKAVSNAQEANKKALEESKKKILAIEKAKEEITKKQQNYGN